MEKRQLIDEIRSINNTAGPEFLAQFDENALAQYRDHLRDARNKVIRIGGWVRPRQQQQVYRKVS